MKIEHIALFFDDLEGAKAFFIKYFDASANALYENPREGFRSYFLTFDSGARLEIMAKTGIGNADRDRETTGYSHLAFSLGAAEQVDALTERLRRDGYRIIREPRTTGDGYYESCVVDLEGNRIELTV